MLSVAWDDGFTPVRMPRSEPVAVLDLLDRVRSAAGAGAVWRWIYRRTAARVPLDRLYPVGEVQVMDEPLVVVDLFVLQPDQRVVAKLQLQFGPPGAALGGAAVPGRADEAVDAVVAWLLDAPEPESSHSVVFETPDGPVVVATSDDQMATPPFAS